MIKYLFLFSIAVSTSLQSFSQQVQISKDELITLTQEWKGERFPDGRPKVPDDIIRRMRSVSVEEAWATMSNAGYRYQIAEGWQLINPDSVLVGRAVTVTFMPGRPDVWKAIDSLGKKEGRRAQNVWGVEILQKGDVYVADQFGAKRNGPTIGDNVGNAIYAKTGNGIVYDGALRDVEGLKEIGGFTSFYSSYDPSYHNPGTGPNRDLTTMIVGINKPTRIRTVTVMPGDVVLGKLGVVVFIPPQLAERVVTTSEIVRLRDLFGHQRLKEGKYTAGQIDTRWSDEIEKDFSKWLNDHINELPVGKEQIQEFLKERTW
ncbi:RraA family protein [Pseudobacter ginsenosidimutans]|uniref:Regulator of RNase E activity RraA n=1 Tax=Pseudobacter ginsenosidimutans TaxID=661488 RepID=A0A4Q7MB84_9BACT|nr:RraA family protein [Pseudobacter ginsenosidimutans]QEC45196.1 RraA family protein [Pseudobacter ginsenosidimutans]RZS65465.1 regulator of RNase E activity RraA [Pseudobacter ginsenosidimutans]